MADVLRATHTLARRPRSDGAGAQSGRTRTPTLQFRVGTLARVREERPARYAITHRILECHAIRQGRAHPRRTVVARDSVAVAGGGAARLSNSPVRRSRLRDSKRHDALRQGARL